MKIFALIVTVMGAGLLPSVPASAEDAVSLSRQEQVEASAKRVKELQEERIATLKDVVESCVAMHRNGRVEFDEVIDAKLLLIDAELELAVKESDRVVLYKKMVEELQLYEQYAEGRKQSARGTHAAILKIKARRLEAEIHLEQAKVRAAQENI